MSTQDEAERLAEEYCDRPRSAMMYRDDKAWHRTKAAYLEGYRAGQASRDDDKETMSRFLHEQRMRVVEDQLTAEKAKVKALVDALRTLKNETRGTLNAHEIAICYDHGNSNWACLQIALERADKALAAYAEGKNG